MNTNILCQNQPSLGYNNQQQLALSAMNSNSMLHHHGDQINPYGVYSYESNDYNSHNITNPNYQHSHPQHQPILFTMNNNNNNNILVNHHGEQSRRDPTWIASGSYQHDNNISINDYLRPPSYMIKLAERQQTYQEPNEHSFLNSTNPNYHNSRQEQLILPTTNKNDMHRGKQPRRDLVIIASGSHQCDNNRDLHPPSPIKHVETQQNYRVVKDVKKFFENLAPGMRYDPTDKEIMIYLERKSNKKKLPIDMIHEVELYKQGPDQLTAIYPCMDEDTWYFFTGLDRKYQNGCRPSRSAGDGYWKPSGKDVIIRQVDGNIVGYKKTLDYYFGKQPDGEKTCWKMHEYRMNHKNPLPEKGTSNNMKMEGIVLCRIYKKRAKKDDDLDTVRRLNDIDTESDGNAMKNGG